MPDYLDIPNPLSDLFRQAEEAVIRKAKYEAARAGEAFLNRATQPFRDAANTMRNAGQAVDRKKTEVVAGVCTGPALAVSDSDWAGEAILERYMTGKGDWNIADDPKWTDYMKASALLRRQVNDKLAEIVKPQASSLKPGTNVVIQATFHADLENGEGIVGYQYLHGTNSTGGIFRQRDRSMPLTSRAAAMWSSPPRCG
jgi:hypothetical protein